MWCLSLCLTKTNNSDSSFTMLSMIVAGKATLYLPDTVQWEQYGSISLYFSALAFIHKLSEIQSTMLICHTPST